MPVNRYYSDETVSLYHGDMREILPALHGQPCSGCGRSDAILWNPYNQVTQCHACGQIAPDGPSCLIVDPPYEETSAQWDRWPDGWLDVAAAVTNSMWCWLPFRQFAAPPYRGQEFAAAGWRLSHDIETEWDHWVWEKNTGSSPVADRLRRVHEPAAHWYRGRWSDVYRDLPRMPHDGPNKGTVRRTTDGADHHTGGRLSSREWIDDGRRAARSVLRAPNRRGKAIHPTEKPPEIVKVMVEYACPPGGTVVDPMAGGGSTGTAVKLAGHGRRCVLIEGHEPYCEAIVRRLQQDVLPMEVG